LVGRVTLCAPSSGARRVVTHLAIFTVEVRDDGGRSIRNFHGGRMRRASTNKPMKLCCFGFFLPLLDIFGETKNKEGGKQSGAHGLKGEVRGCSLSLGVHCRLVKPFRVGLAPLGAEYL
jgi:hypothetical protein